jgi:hypothetical protein
MRNRLMHSHFGQGKKDRRQPVSFRESVGELAAKGLKAAVARTGR